MKNNLFTSIGLMSGTSMDGVDVSVIRSDGISQFVNISDEYFEFDNDLFKKLVELRNIILNVEDLNTYSQKLNDLEREITLFHAKIINVVSSRCEEKIDLVGFHGQTIFHSPEDKISKQLGDGKLLSQLVKKNVLYDFRQNDLINEGQGAPLAPIFHNLLSKIIDKNYSINFPNCFINIGGISNITKIINKDKKLEDSLEAFDVGPGNCMIDNWIRNNSKYKFDQNGLIAKSGKINQLILNQVIDNFEIKSFEKSIDVKDFDISFARGMSLEDGCATITDFTAYLISEGIKYSNRSNEKPIKYLLCGGGRKNSFLVQSIKNYLTNKTNISLDLIDKYNFNGDFIESQAFGYLAIRSYLKLPISYPKTTGCKFPTIGGKLVVNF